MLTLLADVRWMSATAGAQKTLQMRSCHSTGRRFKAAHTGEVIGKFVTYEVNIIIIWV